MKHLHYIPPSAAEAHAFALAVCQRIAQERGPDYNDPEVVHGLAEFVHLAARIQAKHLSRSSKLIDNPTD